MSDSTKTTPFNDLLAKTRKPNHLASQLEKQAAAGATLPRQLSYKYHYLQQQTQLVRQALAGLFSQDVLSDCHVVNASSIQITLSLGSSTAANHVRYMMENCVQALRTYDQRFCQLQAIKVVSTPQLSQSNARPDGIKKTLSENTKQIIAQNVQFVTQNEQLQQALRRLITDDK
ncbi:hypothetical protein ACFBZI_01885 [Moraxella sp. ZJ142]|uniref:hypothetical protein n=1 Tax=Moraxella marmotae TaxID=3344520 RepID=UPI0035D51322